MTEQFHRLAVASVRRLTDDAIEVTFEVPQEQQAAFAFKPGQHVPVRVTIDGVAHRRTYSMCSMRGGPFRIGIKLVPGGVVSTWANTQLQRGHLIDVAAAQGRFTLPESAATSRHLLMLAAGAGITPILGMINEALAHEPDTRITLIYGNRAPASAMFLEELEDLKDRHPARFDILNVFSADGVADTELLQGRIDGAKLKALAGKLIDVKSVERAFLCGPGSFIKETRNALFDLGFARETVHHEFFGSRTGTTGSETPRPTPAPLPVPTEDAIQAIAILDGQRHAFPLRRGQHVLEAALKAGIKAPYSCAGGMCSTCRAHVVAGSVRMTVNYSLEDWELKRGFVLTCQSVATSDTLVVDYDAM